MKVKVKICGIRSLEVAKTAIDAGADFIGLNFVPDSKRKIDIATGKTITRYAKDKIATVGVFQDAPVILVNKLAKELRLDYVQLHGKEDVMYMRQITIPIIKRVGTTTAMEKYKKIPIDFFLLDRTQRGRGPLVNLVVAKKISESFPIFFAGGLTPENVALAIQKVKPFAVDVAGGIETDGKEDKEKIKRFITNAKEVTI